MGNRFEQTLHQKIYEESFFLTHNNTKIQRKPKEIRKK